MGRLFRGFLYASAVSFISATAYSYTPTMMQNGGAVRWRGPVKLNLAGNPVNQSGLGPGDFFQAVVRSLQRWKVASGGSVQFDYWQGSDRAIYESNSEYNGLSSVYFTSNAPSSAQLSPNVLGLTQVWYNTDSGEVLETDIVLNDRDFRFTTQPDDSSGYGAGNTTFSGGRSNVYVENVLSHELGHAFGLSHSGGMQSTMLFMESPEQAHLGCDDQIGIRALYPASDADQRGALTGEVVAESGAPIFGAHVVAISRRRGTVVATALTDPKGRYAIKALEPGAYFLMVEPFNAGARALPSYFASMSNEVCGGQKFSRAVLTDASGSKPMTVGVPAGGSATAPRLVARCGESGGAVITSTPSAASPSSAPVIYSPSLDGAGFGFSDQFSYSSTRYYRLNGVSGSVEIHVLSYSLYSPVRPHLQLLSANGAAVPASVQDVVYQGASGFVNYDTSLTAQGLAGGDYLIQVSGESMSSNAYPAGPVSIDTVPFFLVTGSINEAGPALAATLPANARCRMEENFADYRSPPGNPPRSKVHGDGSGGGFCGSIRRIDEGGPGGGAIVGWFLPWLVMGLIARLARGIRRPRSSLAN